jgi:hypothetical protein
VGKSDRALGIVGAVLTGLLALFLLALAIGGTELATGFGQSMAEAASSNAGRISLAAAGLVLIAAGLFLVLRAIGFASSKTIEFDGDTGQMVVEVKALEECLRRTALEDPDVTDATAAITIPRGGISKTVVCDLDVGLHERADIPGKGAELASQVQRRFLQIIPVENDPLVNLHITIRAPKYESPATAALTPAAGLPAVSTPAEAKEPKPLPDVPEFTGERRYSAGDEEEVSS